MIDNYLNRIKVYSKEANQNGYDKLDFKVILNTIIEIYNIKVKRENYF